MSQHTWRKALVVGVAGLTATLGLAACGDDSDGGSGGDVAVTLITKTDTNPFFVAMAEGAKEAGKEEGVDITTAAGKEDGDTDGQIAAIEDAIARGDDGILITPERSRGQLGDQEGPRRGSLRDRAGHPARPAGHRGHHLRDRQLRRRRFSDLLNPSILLSCVPMATATSDMPAATKGAQTRQAILAAAITRFGREGFRSTSVADVARDAGVGGTVPYAYFPNKEALFLAALDEDAAAVIEEGLTSVLGDPEIQAWRQALIFTLVGAIDAHPLARRVLAGLEPDVTERVLDIPALAELRKACGERLRAEQLAGTVRPDIDATAIGNGVVSVMLSLLMSVVQLGTGTAAAYADDVVAVFEAALGPVGDTPPGRTRRPR